MYLHLKLIRKSSLQIRIVVDLPNEKDADAGLELGIGEVQVIDYA